MTQRMLPLYEGKMIHQYDHRWATYVNSEDARDVTDAEKRDPALVSRPRYWVRESLVRDRVEPRTSHSFLTSFRDIARATDERTTIAASLPVVGVGHTAPLLFAAANHEFALAAFNSLVFDYVARQMIGGTHMAYTTLKQLPILEPTSFEGEQLWSKGIELADWVGARVLELMYTAYDMRAFAEDLGDAGEPFVWDPERRFLLRCELDAAFFHLYGVARDDVDYIMETFPIVRGKDVAAYGEYRTKRVILEVFDAMQAAIHTGEPYRTILNPPPGEGPRHPKETSR
ncbi:MAG: hypothetical protein GX446_12025 [Chthonomonadales bacterium]|nr:hypothetical protein [Chthonomonadales bacterium]